MTKLRSDLLPVWRMLKNKNDELPPLSGDITRGGGMGMGMRGDGGGVDTGEQVQDSMPPPSTLPAPTSGRSLSRKFSMKKLMLGTPKISSPTFPTHHETSATTQYEQPPNNYNSQNNATSPMPGGSFHNNGRLDPYEPHPSPTSPGAQTLHSVYPPSVRAPPPSRSAPPRTPAAHPPNRGQQPDDGDSENVKEIFKSFRVSMDDPCYKVLPAALKRYNIQADWRQYALYIVHGDQERCLGLDERPLILFKQLDRDGRKPMFMLRRNVANGQDSSISVPPGGVL